MAEVIYIEDHTKDTISSIVRLTTCDYLCLYDLGLPSNKVEKCEHHWLEFNLLKYLPSSCLILSASKLASAPESSPAKSILGPIFGNPAKLDKYVAIAAVDKVHPIPRPPKAIYQPLQWTSEGSPSDFPRLKALAEALEQLIFKLNYTSLEKFAVPKKALIEPELVCPFGSRIRKLIGKKSRNSIDEETKRKEGVPHITRDTLAKAEKYRPIMRTSLTSILEYFGIHELESYQIGRVVPNNEKLLEIRKMTGMSKNELAIEFELSSVRFFNLLETAPTIPADKAIFIYNRYKSLITKQGKKAPTFETLINIPATDAVNK